MCVQSCSTLGAAVHELSTVTQISDNSNFDREYLRNGSSNRQAENGVINYDSSTFDENNLVNFGPLTKNDLDLRPMTLKLNRIRAVVKVHVRAKYTTGLLYGNNIKYVFLNVS